MDQTAAFHVPAIHSSGGCRDFTPTDEPAPVMSEISAGALGDRRGAFQVHHMKDGLVGFLQFFRRGIVVFVLVAHEGDAVFANVEMASGRVCKGECRCGVRSGARQKQRGSGDERGADFWEERDGHGLE